MIGLAFARVPGGLRLELRLGRRPDTAEHPDSPERAELADELAPRRRQTRPLSPLARNVRRRNDAERDRNNARRRAKRDAKREALEARRRLGEVLAI